MPVSRTSMVELAVASPWATSSTEPRSVNLRALPTRFFTIVFSFTRSIDDELVARGGSRQAERDVGADQRLARRCTTSAKQAVEVHRPRLDRLAAGVQAARGRGSRSPARRAAAALRRDARRAPRAAAGRASPNSPVGQQVGVAHDDVERRAQLVRHGGHEVGLEPAGRGQVVDQARVLSAMAVACAMPRASRRSPVAESGGAVSRNAHASTPTSSEPP